MPNRDPTCAASAFVFFLLLTPVSPECRKGTADECQKAELVPGGHLAGKGFDVPELTVRDRHWADVDQWKTSDGGCTLCENPLLEGKPLQKLPLIITDWKANITCQQKVHHSLQQSAIAVAEALTKLHVKNDWRAELDVKISPSTKTQWAVAGSRSRMTQSCIRKSSQENNIFLLHHITCSYYKFRVSKDKLLSKRFENDVKDLPEKYDSNSKLKHLEFITTYGTHFGTELDLGAQARFLTAVSVCEAVLEDFSVSELSRCLAIDLGIAFGFDGVTSSPDFQMCEEKKKNPNFFLLLHKMSEEKWGGRLPSNNPKEWLESAKSHPALLSYSLEPLHSLVAKDNPRREGLRQAVSEYVRERALWRNCTLPCPPGSQPSASDFCSCECPNNNFTNSMCCSQKRGLAKLTVTIEQAEGLYGDHFTRTDGYVVVSFQKWEMRTFTIWNNNNPTWNVTFDYGVVQLFGDFSKLRVEIWDEDFAWDDLLGQCEITVEPWNFESQTCYLLFGHMNFKYNLVCGHNLGGPSCRDYSSPWPYNDYFYNDDF